MSDAPSTPDAPIATPAKSDRIASFADFWPYYISEHRNPKSRWLHFIGTSGFLVVLLMCFLTTPFRMGAAVLLTSGALFAGFQMESQRSSAPVLLGTIAVLAFANPFVLLGVVWAYGFAWVGHFRVELNRPATFVYPLWSLAGDFRMYGNMWRGRLWTGNGREIAPVARR
jgi:hypothetical protein